MRFQNLQPVLAGGSHHKNPARTKPSTRKICLPIGRMASSPASVAWRRWCRLMAAACWSCRAADAAQESSRPADAAGGGAARRALSAERRPRKLMQAAQARQANDMRGGGLPSNSNPRTRAQPACFDASSLPPARHRLPSPALHTCGTDIQVRACIADRGADRDERRLRRHDHTLHRGRRHRYRRSERRIYSRRRRHHCRHRCLGHFSFCPDAGYPDIRMPRISGYPGRSVYRRQRCRQR